MAAIYLSLGANVAGLWGGPRDTMAHAVKMLHATRLVCVFRVSDIVITRPIGQIPQPEYLNAVVFGRTRLAPAALLRALKRLERQAGRRRGRRWGPRPLDIDIIDIQGHVQGWPSRGPLGRRALVLPHPEAHRRAFVLGPLAELAPGWVHPVLGRTACQLLHHAAPGPFVGPRRPPPRLPFPANHAIKNS